MPCRCDIQEPSLREEESKRVAQLLVYLGDKIGRVVPKKVKLAANDFYGDSKNADSFTYMLCEWLEQLTESQVNLLVYNGRDKGARKLADWWDEHKAADAKREKEEAERKKKEELKQAALDKLTTEERKALGL